MRRIVVTPFSERQDKARKRNETTVVLPAERVQVVLMVWMVLMGKGMCGKVLFAPILGHSHSHDVASSFLCK